MAAVLAGRVDPAARAALEHPALQAVREVPQDQAVREAVDLPDRSAADRAVD